MARSDSKDNRNKTAFRYSYPYVVLSILFLLTIGATMVYHDASSAFVYALGERWTPVVFLIGLCVSLLLFSMTHRDSAARAALERKTRDLIAAQKENLELLESEQRSRIAAEQANSVKNEFLALISHELKTPLHAIAGWNRILRTRGLSDETRETALDKIDKNLRLQANIVEELLSFSDIMSSDSCTAKKSVSMPDVFESAIAAVNPSAFQKGVTLTSEDKLNDERVLGDSLRLKTALVNILTNAVKFTPPGGRIDAKVFRSEEHIRCVVSDNGFGIPPAFLPHVFEQYKQSQRPTTRQFGGLGLGLTIAHRIVKLHEGTIDAASSGLGGGSTFTISLPIRQ